MSFPVIEQIAQAIETQLADITAANGYETTVPEVIRPKRRGIDKIPAHAGIVLVQEDEAVADDYCVTGNPPGSGKIQTFWIGAVIRISESSNQSFDQAANIIVADIVKALTEDVTWGGLAIDTKVGQTATMQAEDDSFEGVAVPVEVIYRVAENDPYTQV